MDKMNDSTDGREAMCNYAAQIASEAYGIDFGDLKRVALRSFDDHWERQQAYEETGCCTTDGPPAKMENHLKEKMREHAWHEGNRLKVLLEGWHMALGALERVYVGMEGFNPFSPAHPLFGCPVLLVGEDDGPDDDGVVGEVTFMTLPQILRTLGAMMNRERDHMALDPDVLPDAIVEMLGLGGASRREAFESIWTWAMAEAEDGFMTCRGKLEKLANAFENDLEFDEAFILRSNNSGPVLH